MADTQTIKDRIDIVALIGEYITLKKAGANWKANCPFHNEKSPSFMVHADKQIWHCFGCSKGGDIFTFIQEIEGLEFPEALKILAQRAGVEIDTYQNKEAASLRNRLLEINAKAAYFFHNFLLELPASKPARDYLARRGVADATLKDWQIGFVSDQWDLLTKYLLKKGYSIDDLILSGLTIRREGADVKTGRGFYDRFRGRVMFPISDVHGNVVGFTGRVLVETEYSGGKYVNSPQSPLYDKSRVLYGLHKAKTAIKAADLAILVEGQMDVIACHQAGMKNVIAASGTALTPDQIKLIKRYTNNIAMAFDADEAGINAGQRGIDIALAAGMRIRVIQIPAGFAKDADECLKKDKNVWFKSVDEATEIMDWYISLATRRYDLKKPAEKRQAAQFLSAKINTLPSAVERDEWLRRAADALMVEVSALREEAKQLRAQPAPRALRSEAGAPEVAKAVKLETSPELLIQNEFWSLLMKYPAHYSALHTSLQKEHFEATPFKGLYENCEKIYNEHGLLNVEALRRIYPEGQENIVDILSLRPYRDFEELSEASAKLELIALLDRIKQEWKKNRRREIQHAIAQAEKNKDAERLKQLMVELQSL